MAQQVAYYENDVIFTEGPFVVVSAYGFRIEAEIKGSTCPTLPDISIYKYCERMGLKTENREVIAKTVDKLNEAVRLGIIVLHPKGYWHVPE